MDKNIEDVLHKALKPINEPDPELNRQILDRRLKKDMRKFNLKKWVAAAAVGILITAGGVSVYAASQNLSLLSLFQGESKEVRDNAEELLDKEVAQGKGLNEKQSRLATFKIREAIVDKNQVTVQVEVRAVEPEKYLLVCGDAVPEIDSVSNLGMDGVSGDQTIDEYAKSLGKKCLRVAASISGTDSASQSIANYMEKDGTLLYNISFMNTEKRRKLHYICNTFVYPSEGEDVIKDKIDFTLKDNSNVEQMKYVPDGKGNVPGTDLVIDEVTFEKSELEMVCNVKYHYVGKSKDWTNTKDFDMGFYLLGTDGRVIESKGGGTQADKTDATVFTQSWSYSLQELPETLTFQAKDVMEKIVYGTVDVRLAK